jgi:hypothetical protein
MKISGLDEMSEMTIPALVIKKFSFYQSSGSVCSLANIREAHLSLLSVSFQSVTFELSICTNIDIVPNEVQVLQPVGEYRPSKKQPFNLA